MKWRAIRKSGMRGRLEARLRRFDGEYRWFLFEAEPLRDEAGNIVKWYGSSTDIEDRKRAEEALRDSEQRFRDYAETASDWLWETGPTTGSRPYIGARQCGRLRGPHACRTCSLGWLRQTSNRSPKNGDCIGADA